MLYMKLFQESFNVRDNWRPPSLSEPTPIISYLELTHLGSEAFNCIYEMINFSFYSLFAILLITNYSFYLKLY